MNSWFADSAWRDWYRAKHESRWSSLSGVAFEEYVQSALKLIDPEFINPDPMGSIGDKGCDGLSGDGKTLYACYGSSSLVNSESKLTAKLQADFSRALDQWPEIETWAFVTNAKFGPNALKLVSELRREHAAGAPRSVDIIIWNHADDLWANVLGRLAAEKLDVLFPGVPHAQNVDLADMVELLDSLREVAPGPGDVHARIDPVAETKMDYNNIPAATRLEFNAGRSCAWRIDDWFEKQVDPTLRDRKAAAFNDIYLSAKKAHGDAQEIVEEVYTALGGSDFRYDSKRANAVYAVTAYFFDTCDIFEKPPTVDEGEGREE